MVHKTIQGMRQFRKALHPSKTIGFVPTMGNLHDGHLSLVNAARQQNDIVVVSIYVNPTQFAPTDDLEHYPRTLELDTQLLQQHNVDVLFCPDTLYSPHHTVTIHPNLHCREDTERPGHFSGVATVVTKLFNIVQPSAAYFGQKDAAQCVLVRKLVDDLNMDYITIHVQETIREPDGLAMSSRNSYLTPCQRGMAPLLYQSLVACQQLYQSTSNVAQLRQCIETVLVQSRQQKNSTKKEQEELQVQYVCIDRADTLEPFDNNPMAMIPHECGALVSVAVRLGRTRLIDNVILPPKSATT